MNKNMIKQLQDAQKKLMKAQEELGQQQFEGTAGGVVTVVVTGHGDLVSVTIDPEACTPEDVEMLQDSIVAAFQAANGKVKAANEKLFGGLTGGMKMPGLF